MRVVFSHAGLEEEATWSSSAGSIGKLLVISGNSLPFSVSLCKTRCYPALLPELFGFTAPIRSASAYIDTYSPNRQATTRSEYPHRRTFMSTANKPRDRLRLEFEEHTDIGVI